MYLSNSNFRYIFNHLSVLSDEELEKINFESVNSVLNESDISAEDRDELAWLFNTIQNELSLNHHGILGMKWGVRRYQNKDGKLTSAGKKHYGKSSLFGTAAAYQIKTRSGEIINAEPVKPWPTGEKILNAILGVSEKQILGRRGDANYTLNNSKGQKIGELSLINKNKDTAYIDWITIDNKHRGQGYATDIINDLLIKAKKSGYSKVQLNALKEPRPLYERIGFTYSEGLSVMDRISGFEFGTKRMEYDLNNIEHSSTANELYHYGVLGMKWGVHRSSKSKSKNSSTRKKNNESVYTRVRREQKKYVARSTAALVGVDLGRRAVNQYLNDHNVTLNGQRIGISDNATRVGQLAVSYLLAQDYKKRLDNIG